MSSETEELRAYVRRALEAGASRTDIRAGLSAAGWGEPQIARALDAWADLPGPLAVPRPRPSISAREAFMYLTLFAALYLTAWYFGSLLFDLIDLAVPDPVETHWSWPARGDSIRWSIAALVVAAPLYLWLSHRLNREIAADPVRRQSPVRLWLGNLTLFIAALVIIGALVSVIYSLLAGELTLRFLLKVAVVAGISAAVFGYYHAELEAGEVK